MVLPYWYEVPGLSPINVWENIAGFVYKNNQNRLNQNKYSLPNNTRCWMGKHRQDHCLNQRLLVRGGFNMPYAECLGRAVVTIPVYGLLDFRGYYGVGKVVKMSMVIVDCRSGKRFTRTRAYFSVRLS